MNRRTSTCLRSATVLAALLLVLHASPAVAATKVTAADQKAATRALKSQITLLTQGQLGKAWDQIHPAQQALVTREHYIACGSPAAGSTLTQFDVQAASWERTEIPGATTVVDALALTVRYALNGRTATTTFHEIPVGKHWRFTLSTIDRYANGACP
jgi:hypothetical protein